MDRVSNAALFLATVSAKWCGRPGRGGRRGRSTELELTTAGAAR
eukprot:CAMPEP_0202109980 /NCGR_PEP_ID=MMETSP0965-20130614/25369_1 /ASSEMBLY_ACC=CAM_ASM_000507 /TAXON_ID=4773 /ORGANISM="Schizochytrium aggregatum, Strain ATCC28209" /LENGTH=43 /DNA_ID= /DNA_START= /DNA_END= /DNA_ORIENTATION=